MAKRGWFLYLLVPIFFSAVIGSAAITYKNWSSKKEDPLLIELQKLVDDLRTAAAEMQPLLDPVFTSLKQPATFVEPQTGSVLRTVIATQTLVGRHLKASNTFDDYIGRNAGKLKEMPVWETIESLLQINRAAQGYDNTLQEFLHAYEQLLTFTMGHSETAFQSGTADHEQWRHLAAIVDTTMRKQNKAFLEKEKALKKIGQRIPYIDDGKPAMRRPETEKKTT